jgi:hypothetical protein
LRLVDGEMGRGRAVLSLRDEDLVAVGRGHLLSCYGSGRTSVHVVRGPELRLWAESENVPGLQ